MVAALGSSQDPRITVCASSTPGEPQRHTEQDETNREEGEQRAHAPQRPPS